MKINKLASIALLAVAIITSSCSGSRFSSKAPESLTNEDKIVYFDFDSAKIEKDYNSQIKKKVAKWIVANPKANIIVEGHCDERGSFEYNKKLGYERANAVKELLVSYGVDASRIKVVSYGEKKPVAKGSNEEAWKMNRRAVTVTLDK